MTNARKASTVQVSFIIISWNTRELLRECLKSIYAGTQELSFEVFVVDNNSRDGSAKMVAAEFSSVNLIHNPVNVGFARANNRALKKARGQYIVLLNPDTVLLSGMLEQCIAFVESSPTTGVVGGELLNPDGSFQAGYFDFPTFRYQLSCLFGTVRRHFLQWKANYSPFPSVREVDWVSGAFMVVRREAIIKAGLMDERFFMYSEETEWCYRIRKAGWKVHYLSYVKIIHYHRQSTKQAPVGLKAHTIRSQQILFWTHYPKVQAAALMILSMGVGLAFIIKGLFHPRVDWDMRRRLIQTGVKIIGYCLETGILQQPQVPTLSSEE